MRTPRALAARRAGFIGGFFAVGVGLSAAYAVAGVGINCPFRLLTGWDCPFCGATRMGAALLRGDVPAAFAANPVVLIALVVLGVFGIGWATEAAGGGRWASRALGLARRVSPVFWAVLGGTAALGFTLIRNLS